MSAAEVNLQIKERTKLMRGVNAMPDSAKKIPGDQVINGLVKKSIVLIPMPMPMEPHVKWVPLMDRLLFNLTAN